MEFSDHEAIDLMEDGAVTIPEACEFSGLGRSKLYQQIAAGRLQVIKVGRRTLIPKRSLMRLLAEHLISEPE